MTTWTLTRAAMFGCGARGVPRRGARLRAPASRRLPLRHRRGSIQVVGSDSTSRFVPLGIGKSVVIDLPRDVKDVLVADPKIANAVVRTSRRAYLIGVAVGQTSVFFFDAEGRQIAGFDIAVTRDLNGVRAALQQMFPNADVRVDGVGDGVMLTGRSRTRPRRSRPLTSRHDWSARADKVVNGLTIRGRDQVMLKVTVAEVQRDVIKQLGIDINGSRRHGTAVLNFDTANPFTALGQPLVDGNARRRHLSIGDRPRRCARWSAPA